MLRRNARLRKEYLYRKSLEGKERTTYEQKRKLRDALAGMAKSSLSTLAWALWYQSLSGARISFRTALTGTLQQRHCMSAAQWTAALLACRGQAHSHRAAPRRGPTASRGGSRGRQHSSPPQVCADHSCALGVGGGEWQQHLQLPSMYWQVATTPARPNTLKLTAVAAMTTPAMIVFVISGGDRWQQRVHMPAWLRCR